MKKIFLLGVAALSLVACDDNKENEPAATNNVVKVSASIGQSSVSSRTDCDTKWDKGDVIGISSIVGGLRTPFVNLEYTTLNGDGEFTGETPIFFYKPMTLLAYYPFTGTEGTAPGTDGVIKADTKIEMQAPGKQNLIDFLWDARQDKVDFSVANPTVNFQLSHMMSKLTFTFLKSEETRDNHNVIIAKGVDVGDMISYGINGLGLVGTFDTYTGVCAIDEEEEARSMLTVTFDKGTVENEKPMPSLIVFPQTQPADDNFTLHITTSEVDQYGQVLPDQHYKCVLPFSDKEIKAGYHYKFTVQVTKVGLILGEMSIEEWKPAREWSGTATIDGNIFGTEETDD
ncbi:MAG: fimbrillin family protein [Muribaculaceae bacterium]|nr:fimbrillin family protein [Muribaculaceae bacterium]